MRNFYRIVSAGLLILVGACATYHRPDADRAARALADPAVVADVANFLEGASRDPEAPNHSGPRATCVNACNIQRGRCTEPANNREQCDLDLTSCLAICFQDHPG
jgi:hypothetical protein